MIKVIIILTAIVVISFLAGYLFADTRALDREKQWMELAIKQDQMLQVLSKEIRKTKGGE